MERIDLNNNFFNEVDLFWKWVINNLNSEIWDELRHLKFKNVRFYTVNDRFVYMRYEKDKSKNRRF